MPSARAAAMTLLLVAGAAAGCLSSGGGDDAGLGMDPLDPLAGQLLPDGRIDHDAIDALIGTPIAMLHEERDEPGDHTHAADHTGSFNLEFVAWSTLGVTLGDNGFANFVLHDADDGRTLAFVAVDGDSEGGFSIADVTDPGNITPVGHYRAPGSGFQEVRVTPDGRYAILNVQDIPAPGPGLADPSSCSVCMHVVDVTDPAEPTLSSIFPVEVQGTHNMDVVAIDGATYVIHVGQPLGNEPPGNRLGVLRLVDSPAGAVLVPVSTFAHPAMLDDGRSYPHDVLVQMHPDGRRIAYVSHWDGGLVTFDLSDPATPVPLGVSNQMAPSSALAIHWAIQEEQRRPDGKVYAWSAPEIGTLEDGTGVVRAYDASDPAAITQVGTWELPGELAILGRYILSPHVTAPDQSTGLMAVAHYHAGVWILDISDPTSPRALGYYLPHGDPGQPYDGPAWWKKPNFNPDGYLPNAYMVRWHDGLLWATERGTGLYALRYTGPVPGPVI